MSNIPEQTERVIARIIQEKALIYTLEETDEFCVYNGGYFHRGKQPLNEIRKWINEEARLQVIPQGETTKPYYLTPSRKSTIIEMIKSGSFISFDEFIKPDKRVCVLNGHVILNGDNEWVYWKHFDYNESPYKTFIQIPVIYDPKAEGLVIDQFLTDVFGFKTVPLIYEMLAYFLMPHVKYQKAFILYGPPSTGKTTFYDLIKKFYNGLKNFSELRLQELGIHFEMQNLMGKLVNYFDDLTEKQIGDSEAFRRIVTNNHLSSAMKFVNGRIYWINRTKLAFSCNTLPKIKKNEGNAFFRRWVLISCFNVFKDKDIMTQDDLDNSTINTKDYDMLDKMTTPEEFSGLLNNILKGWLRLEARGNFPKEWNDIEYIKGLWQIDINPVKLFVDECCILGPSNEEDYNLFYQTLNKFREEHNAKPISKAMCTQWLQRIDGITKKRKTGGEYFYKGISIQDNANKDGKIDIDKILVNKKTISDYNRDVDYSDPDMF